MRSMLLLGVFLAAYLSSCEALTYFPESASVGFESLKYESLESSDVQVCLNVNGTVHWSFSVLINTHVGTADESDYGALHDHTFTIQPGTQRPCLTVAIVNDGTLEGNETFSLSLEEPAGGLRSGININQSSNGTFIRIVNDDALPDCRSFLRFIQPHLFGHCSATCTYPSNFSNWATVPATAVSAPLGLCRSGMAHIRTRSKTATQPGCAVKTERNYHCILTPEERLINTFNLAVQPESVVEPPPGIVLPPLPPAGIVTNYRFSNLTKRQAPSSPQYCSSTRVCEGISTSHRSCPDQSACAPTHGNNCPTRTIVFVLDTSGSITTTDFQRMTTAIGDIVPLFCDNIKIAVVSYNANINVEFCFGCYNLCSFESILAGTCINQRTAVSNAIKNIQYRGGSTSTGVATRCVSDKILNPSWGCGVDTSSECVDVIFVTDGQSNGPLSYPQTCEEITCLKNHPQWCGRVNTYAIAIGSGVNQAEVDCLTRHDEDSIYSVANFAEFEALVNRARMLLGDPTTGYFCVKQSDKFLIL